MQTHKCGNKLGASPNRTAFLSLVSSDSLDYGYFGTAGTAVVDEDGRGEETGLFRRERYGQMACRAGGERRVLAVGCFGDRKILGAEAADAHLRNRNRHRSLIGDRERLRST